jgi:vanillate O-demethylase ferredoxin subunit
MLAENSWDTASVRAVRDLTPAIREIALAPAAGVRPYVPGSHIDVGVLIDGRMDRRSYSLVGEAQDGCYRIAVKLLPESRGGSRAMWRLRPGAPLEISAPLSSFALVPGSPETLLIAGGIGITPLRSMASVLRRRNDNFRLLYCGRARGDMAYLDELAAELGDRLVVHASGEGNRLDLGTAIERLHPAGELYLCGPLAMLEDARLLWAESGRHAATLRTESFGSSGRHPTRAFRVRVPRLDLEIEVPETKSMLDALAGAGVEILAECRRGECGLCAVDVIAADAPIDHRDVFLSAGQRAAGTKICACVSRLPGGCIAIDPAWRPD